MGAHPSSQIEFMMNYFLMLNVHGIGTAHKRLKGLIKKYGITWLVISEPFFKDDALCRIKYLAFQSFVLMRQLMVKFGFCGVKILNLRW